MNLALFDLDGTLIPSDSDHAFGAFLVERGWADSERFRQGNDAFYADYLAGQLDIHAYVEFASKPWRARSQAELAQVLTDFMAQCVLPMVHEQAQALVRGHQQAGDLVAVVTATNEVVTRPIAQAFGVQALIAVEMARDAAGRYTGAIQGVPSFREGKIERVNQWLQQQGLRWQQFDKTTFYSDSTNDLPLLERVSHPVATNPTPALERIAHERGWATLKLFP
jgi:HAD superfamily hydrolase (TIGR01490 family)